MKHRLTILVVLWTALAGAAITPPNGAAPIRFSWDASATPGVTNYVLYAATNYLTSTNLSSAVVRVSAGTNLTATITDLVPGRWYFAATAMKDAAESAPSNVLQIQVPTPPANLLTVVVQYSTTVTNGFTDTGFFRLRIP